MRLLLDADGLIKLHRAGVVGTMVKAFRCTVPEAVYYEVVTRGKERLHQDAEEIEQILGEEAEVVRTEQVYGETGLGTGEMAVLTLAVQHQSAIVVSDDRRFLAILSTRGLPFLTPVDLLVVLARRRILTKGEAKKSLERLRPMVRAAAYWEANEDLEQGVSDEE